MAISWIEAIFLGVLQGVLEWLPISSEGAVSLVLTSILHADPLLAVQLSLFLHVGTALAATGYYRESIASLFVDDRGEMLDLETMWQRQDLRFLLVGTVASGVVGIAVYAVLESILVGLPTRAFLLGIGLLLLVTGALQYLGEGVSGVGDRRPRMLDAVMVGIGQGLALLPGVSRSGTTISILLLREYETEQSLELSFLLAIPASLGAGVLVVLDVGGIPSVTPGPAVAALLGALVVGYGTIGALVRVVRRLPFWSVCIVFGLVVVATGLI
ncbi:MAG: undecaprenyl-diphosphate phosphatase [Halodesulfurarchaeum sp.]